MNDLSHQSWYHGKINREQTESILTGKNPGTFLVRDSKSLVGDYVLSVSESGKVSHYIINHKGTYYQIGDQTFPTIPEIIEFYKKYLLDKTTLKEAVEKAEKLKALFNFDSQDPEDLPFKKGDTLTLVKKVEDNWWRAKNGSGREGMVPRNYVQLMSQESPSSKTMPATGIRQGLTITGSRHSHPEEKTASLPMQSNSGRHSSPIVSPDQRGASNIPQNDGFDYAIAVMDHIKVYDDDLLSFNKGDVIKIIKKHEDGSWFGETKNKTGKFSFTYVKLLAQNEQNGV